MDRWRVNILGRFELRAPARQEVALGARKSMALLALLAAAPGQRMARDRVAGLLWEDMPDAQARGNLRQLLAATRRPAPFLKADAGSIGFAAGMVETDIAAFEGAIAEDTPAALERAAELYRADYLDGFSLRDRDFDDWLTGERERLREHAVQLFLRLMERATAIGVEPAIRWALRILAVDPVHEPAHRALMELYAAQGRHAAALRQYEQLRETLARELDTRPEPETDALMRRIRDNRRGPARPVTEPLPVETDAGMRVEARPLPDPPPVPDTPSIVVLPFQNLSADPEQEYFSDGIVEEITTALSRFRSLFVISRNSAFTYKGRAVDVRQVGRELGVRYLLDGSVQGHKDALQLFDRAIELDPDFASAYGMAAYSYFHRKTNGWIVDREAEIAETARLARRAVELDKDDAVALSCGGFALAYVAGELNAGVAFIDRALLLNPNLATAWIVSGWVRVWLGEPEVAIAHLARAMRLSPLDPLINRTRTTRAHAHFFAGRYDEASSWAAMALREWPDYQTALRIAAASNALAGRLEEAKSVRERLQKLDPKLRISSLEDELAPYHRPQDIGSYVEGLLAAGL